MNLLQWSRLFVKNLPKYVTEQRVKDHFAQRGEVTDVRIIKNKNTGESRQFGFVGYRTEKQAKEAQRYFNNSFLDTRKLEVSIAKAVGDSALPVPWSRHSKGSQAYKRLHPEEEPDKSDEPSPKKQKLTNEDKEHNKEYFMNLVKSSKGQLWKDDNLLPEAKKVSTKTMADGTKATMVESYVPSKKTGGDGVFYEKKRIVFADSDEESEGEDYQGIVVDHEPEEDAVMADTVAHDEGLSDMDYLRAKMVQKQELEVEDEESEDIEAEEDSVDSSHSQENVKEPIVSKEESSKEESPEEESKDKEVQSLFDDDDDEDIGETGRLFVRNLPFSTIEEELVSHFSRFGELSEVHLPVDPDTKQGKGYAFVQFMIPSDALKAFERLDNTIFQGRLIHILPGKSMTKVQQEAQLSSDAKSSYKKKKELKSQEISNDDTNWNTIFLRSDTVANAIADSLEVKKSDLFNPEADNMAVRMALAEAQIIQQTKQSLEEEGVNLDALKYHNAKDYKRSNSVILVKNLPYSTKLNELHQLFSPFGTLGRVILPPTKAIALIEFSNSNDAKRAFRALAYKRFKHVPLYLEWTPELIFNISNDTVDSESVPTENIKKAVIENEEISQTESSTLYVKNLNFSTTEQQLQKLFTDLLGESSVRSSRIAKSKGKNSQSLGYGFVELIDKPSAVKALKSLQGAELEEHHLVLKFSKSNAKPKTQTKRKVSAKAPSKAASSKLMIRNLAFEAERKDLRQLCSPFGQIKAVRIPKKFDGRSRGYGFVEFLTKQDAKNCLEKLTNAHLYGRHLVIEYAADKNVSVDELRQKAKDNLS